MKLLHTLSLLIVVFFSSILAAPAADVGDPVAALWRDGHYYTGQVIEIRGDGLYRVLYDDGDRRMVSPKNVRVLRNRKYEVGERVIAARGGVRMYSGVVVGKSGAGYVIDWNDGAKRSTVPSTRMIPKQ